MLQLKPVFPNQGRDTVTEAVTSVKRNRKGKTVSTASNVAGRPISLVAAERRIVRKMVGKWTGTAEVGHSVVPLETSHPPLQQSISDKTDKSATKKCPSTQTVPSTKKVANNPPVKYLPHINQN